jgi:hypothetical protein
MSRKRSNDEPLKYIGYSMRTKQWYIVNKNKKQDDTYEFFNAGARAFTYINRRSNKLVKIIHGPHYVPEDNYAGFINNCEKEIEYQQRAAENGLGPRVYEGQYGFVPKEDSFYSKNEFPYFYIVMEYLSEKNGWNLIHIGDKPDSLFCEYIEKLVSKTGLINIEDPRTHLYYNDKKEKLYMIDYGNYEECGDRSVSECVELMNIALGVQCASSKKTKRTKDTKDTTETTRTIKRRKIEDTTKTKSGGYTKQLRKRKTHKRKTHKRKTHKRRHIK